MSSTDPRVSAGLSTDSVVARVRTPMVLIAVALLIVTALHYGTPRDMSYFALHDVWRRLYYVPIVLGAFHYGLRGGLFTAFAVTLLYLPHLLFQWGGMAHGNQYIELLMFWVIGLITGLLAGELRSRREEAHEAYRKLAESFDRTKEAERLAAMGQLSAALAHEIRNPLASIKGSLPILLEGIDAGDPRQEFGAIVRKELQRLDDLTAEFLAYARPPRPTWVEEDLNAVVRGVIQLVGKEAERSGVAMDTKLDSQLPLIWMDSDRIRQVLLNLSLNAIEAMPDGGRVEIRTSPLPDSVLLTIQDSGPGIPDELRDRIFEPFVTSKKSGTGLGLAVVHNWVTRHGGTIELGTNSGTGACFRIWFPYRTDAPADPSATSGGVRI